MGLVPAASILVASGRLKGKVLPVKHLLHFLHQQLATCFWKAQDRSILDTPNMVRRLVLNAFVAEVHRSHQPQASFPAGMIVII